MYLHLGQDYIVPLQTVVAVFDMDTATASKRTRGLLSRMQEEGRIIELYEAKSFVTIFTVFNVISTPWLCVDPIFPAILFTSL